MFVQGKGTPVSSSKAMLWWKAAAKMGDGLSAWAVASFYLSGLGVNQDMEVGLEWLKKAAALHCVDAHEELAEAYGEGRLGLTREPEKAENHAKLARPIKLYGATFV